jgi:hypothetical protein
VGRGGVPGFIHGILADFLQDGTFDHSYHRPYYSKQIEKSKHSKICGNKWVRIEGKWCYNAK